MIRLSILPLFISFIFLFSCQGEFSRFQFIQDSQPIDLKEHPGIKPAEEGTFFLKDGKLQSPVYSLKEPAAIEEEGKAFSLTYSVSGTSLLVSLHRGKERDPVVVPLPENNGKRTEIRIPLDAPTLLTGFQVYADGEKGAGELFQAGLDSAFSGIKYLPDRILQGSMVQFTEKTEEMEVVLPSLSDGVVKLEYVLPGSGTEELKIPLTAANRATGEKKTLYVKPSSSGDSLYLYKEYLGFAPDRINMATRNGDFRLLAAEVLQKATEDEREPLPADLTTILHFDQAGWRSAEFELFSWNAYPRILIFDTADYSVQARLFKRLAFFVEKEGYTGTLLTNDELRGKHGWNAHDYRAEDLADFFLHADEAGFSLNREELVLKEILLDNGILSMEGGNVRPGEGGLISISRESPGYLREKFIIHEGTHGIFFTDSLYREMCFARWDELPGEGKSFWKLFFAWNNYDSDDRYLVVNEYQAYMLQQHVKRAEQYFRNHGASRWIKLNRDPEDGAVRFFNEENGVFEKYAAEMDETFHSATGFRAGDLFSIEEAE